MNELFKIEAKVKKNDKDLKKIIETCGIEYPHESLAFFSSVYAKFEEPNKNKVELANSVKDQVPQLRGTQVNINHLRKNWIVGTILDAWVVKDEIKIAFSFYKSVYPDLYEEALELLDKNKLTVSFELRVEKADIETKSNGIKRLRKVSFDGVGLLLDVSPACPEAIVYEQANINQLREQDLVFANKIKHINKEEDLIVDKKANDALLAKQKQCVIEEFGEDAVKDWSDDDFCNEAKIEEFRKSLNTETSEVKVEKIDEVSEEQSEVKVEDVEEVKKEEIVEEVVEEAQSEVNAEQTVIETETKQIVKETMDNDKNTDRIEVNTDSVKKVNDKVVSERKETLDVTYTYAQVEEIKAEYEKKLEAKDIEIKFIKDNAQKIIEIRSELGDFVKDLSDEELFNEDKIKIAKLQKENTELKNKEKTVTTASENIEENLETGHDEVVVEEGEEKSLNTYIKNRYNQNKK